MDNVTRILKAVQQGDQQAADELMPVVYGELRRLAQRKLVQEAQGQTLQPTALVNEAYIRLVDVDQQQQWDSRGHFFSAAAEAMRRILVDNARRKRRHKHGGGHQRVEWRDADAVEKIPCEELLALDEALERLGEEAPKKAELVKLRYFAGLTLEQAADVMNISRATAARYWTFARALLYDEISRGSSS